MTASSMSSQIPDAAAALQLQLNGEPVSLPAGSTLQDLLLARGELGGVRHGGRPRSRALD